MGRDPRYEMDFGAVDESDKTAAELEVERHAASVRMWGPDNETQSRRGAPLWPGAGEDERDFSPETP